MDEKRLKEFDYYSSLPERNSDDFSIIGMIGMLKRRHSAYGR